jgi:hypothetical protein
MKKFLAFWVTFFILSGSVSYAALWHHHGYYYSGGHWWIGDTMVAGLEMGAVVEDLPPQYTTVYINGANYFYDGTYYYQSCPTGYMVVQPGESQPVINRETVEPVQPQTSPGVHNAGSVTVTIDNSNGTSTKIMLVRKGNGYVGPEGEYYDSMPTTKQLKAVYGK